LGPQKTKNAGSAADDDEDDDDLGGKAVEGAYNPAEYASL